MFTLVFKSSSSFGYLGAFVSRLVYDLFGRAVLGVLGRRGPILFALPLRLHLLFCLLLRQPLELAELNFLEKGLYDLAWALLWS